MSEVRSEPIDRPTQLVQIAELSARLKFGDQIPESSLLVHADARNALAHFPDEFFQTCITSPPYWGLRDYALPGQIGAEDELDDYLDALTTIFEDVRRVLRTEGSLWLNIGDGYTSGNRGWRATDRKNPARAMGYRPRTPPGLKPKDLLGIPWRLAFRLQQSGWFLRSDIIWHKPNCQPESVKDRPTRAHEYLFQFTKSDRYYYDHSAMVEETVDGKGVRNKRSVWSVPTVPNSLPHAAVFPADLIEPCLLATSKRGDWVLDPFFGTGTTGLLAERHDRNWVGVELKPEYLGIASERLNIYDLYGNGVHSPTSQSAAVASS